MASVRKTINNYSSVDLSGNKKTLMDYSDSAHIKNRLSDMAGCGVSEPVLFLTFREIAKSTVKNKSKFFTTISQSTLARRVGVTRQTINKAVTALKKEGLIWITNRSISTSNGNRQTSNVTEIRGLWRWLESKMKYAREHANKAVTRFVNQVETALAPIVPRCKVNLHTLNLFKRNQGIIKDTPDNPLFFDDKTGEIFT